MRRIIALTIASVLGVVVLCFIFVFRYRDNIDQVLQQTEETPQTQSLSRQTEETEYDHEETEAPAALQTETQVQTEDLSAHAEDGVYTFLQGPVAWNSKTPWSGIWCEAELDGGTFSVFGCGLCDMAGIYSTLTPYECSPLDMYALARKVSDYSPGYGAGAIDWPFMVQTLEKTGFTVQLKNKDKSYKAFQKAVTNCLGAIVLISSEQDDTYWQDTPGHYVNIWHYRPETDEVFLGDSGNPSHNRSWIPLRYIYDALAKDSSCQYMLVTGYSEDKNEWKYSGIVEKWTIPSYYTAKPLSESLLKKKEQAFEES